MIYDSHIKIVLGLVLVLVLENLPAQTPVFYSAPGQTNLVVLTAWPPPPNGNTWVQYGTNTVYLGMPITNTPNASGWFSNSFFPTLYKVSIPAYGSGAFFYANIYNTTNCNSLGFYATNIAVANNVLGSAQLIAAMLGYTPVANTNAAIVAALGYTPVANTFAAISNVLQFPIATNGGVVAYAQLPFTPVTNNYAALTNILGFVPATNGGPLSYAQLPYMPPTNSYAGISNVLGFVIATNNPQSFTWTNIVNVNWITNGAGNVTNIISTLATNTLNYTHP